MEEGPIEWRVPDAVQRFALLRRAGTMDAQL